MHAPLNLAQLTDELLFFPHLAKIKLHAIYLIIDCEIFLLLTAFGCAFYITYYLQHRS